MSQDFNIKHGSATISESFFTPFANAMQHAVRAAVKRLNLVTREEFDIQTQVLIKTRLHVQRLETQINALLEEKNT